MKYAKLSQILTFFNFSLFCVEFCICILHLIILPALFATQRFLVQCEFFLLHIYYCSVVLFCFCLHMSMFLFWTNIYKSVSNFNSCSCKCTSSLYPIVFIENIYFDTNNFILCTIFVCSDDKPYLHCNFFYIFLFFILCFMSVASRHSRSLLSYHK